MKSLTVQGVEEWLYSDFHLQKNKHLHLSDKFIFVHIKLSYKFKVKWQHPVNTFNFWSWEELYHNLIDLQQTRL